MKLGADRKKVGILVGLVVIAIAIFIFNGAGSSDPGAASSAGTRPSTTGSGVGSMPGGPVAGGGLSAASSGTPGSAAKGGRGRATAEFRPYVGRKRGQQDQADPTNIDPTLKLDTLARLQTVSVTGLHRSVFDFSQPPAPKVVAPKIAGPKVPSPIVPPGGVKPVDLANVDPAKPSAPPIPLKFYGYVSPRGDVQKRAFFVDGEEIHVVREGEVVKRRYKIVRIGVNSVVVEDSDFPGKPQTLPLEEQPG